MTTPLSSAAINPEANAAEVSRKELQDKLNGLGGLSGRKLDPEAKAKKLREACEGFESIFIQKMWQEMRNTVPQGGLMHGKEEKFWQDIYDQELSKSMTKAGGIGLADMMYEQLSRNLVSASRTTVGQGGASPFTPAAAPLINSGMNEMEEPVEEHAATFQAANIAQGAPSIYDGEAPETGAAPEEEDNGQSAVQTAQPGASVAQAQVAPEKAPVINAVQASATAEKTDENSDASNAAHHKKVSHSSGAYENNGLNLAYLAKREAGDKLGSRAVRPALHQRKERAVKAEAVEQTDNLASGALITQSGQLVPGSTAGLQAALELARTGQGGAAANTPNLQNLVAAVQARNNLNQVQNSVSENATGNSQPMSAEPVTRKVRYTTNVPKANNSKARKKADQAIRMLNVDNVGVNSKQGQGVAAYHAQQEAAAQKKPEPATIAASNASQPVQAAAPIAPLTASAVREPETGDASFTVPPLRAGNLQDQG